MGSFQSKLTGEVPVVGTPGSPSESQPLNNGEKPMAPFRDPRSISDDVERTPIQIAAEKRAKKNEASKENEMPALNETPTAPSLPSRFKVNINEANMTLSPKMIELVQSFDSFGISNLAPSYYRRLLLSIRGLPVARDYLEHLLY